MYKCLYGNNIFCRFAKELITKTNNIMNWTESQEAIEDAKRTLKKADNMVGQLGFLMVGRLNLMNSHTLSALKKELKNFNSVTGKWK